ncbi:unnamed protein product [Closterium sp. NIES-64]|nr:unnamed protein product [Closterium sp. NIES-64]CAI5997346.1 unnamed protein product [Closterium sp. NIES-64]
MPCSRLSSPQSPLAAFARCRAALGPTRTYKAAGQQQGARRSSGSSVVSGRGERWDAARPGLALLTTAAELLDYCTEGCCWPCQDPSAPHATARHPAKRLWQRDAGREGGGMTHGRQSRRRACLLHALLTTPLPHARSDLECCCWECRCWEGCCWH